MSLESPISLPRVAVVDDEADLRDNVVDFLGRQSFPVWGVESAEALYRRWLVDPADVLILDVGLPGEDGFQVAQHMRRYPRLGIIMVSARGKLQDRLTGLELGADSYLVKPVDLTILSAQILAVWRRVSTLQAAENTVGSNVWLLDRTEWSLRSPAGKSCSLTANELAFLGALFDAGGEAVGRRAIAAALKISDELDYDHRIDVLVSRLRKKVEAETGSAMPLKTVQARGFVFTAKGHLCGSPLA